HGVLAALWQRERTGEGCLVEASLLETAIGLSSWTSAGYLADPEKKEPTRQGSRHRQNAPYQRFATKDGYIMIGAGGQSIWTRFANALGHPEWVEDPRWPSGAMRVKNREALETAIEDVLANDTTDHWVNVLEEAGVPCGPVYNYGQMFADPQVQHRQMVVTAQDDELGEVPHIRSPIKITGGGVAVRSVAPKLGQHNEEVFGAVGVSASDLTALRKKGVV
ncbi:MAG TPA: CoA transferase, partial [Alphaproteobacteria bacterium]|nr:CoA transferase [Alphaproteobacteria bacterium]